MSMASASPEHEAALLRQCEADRDRYREALAAAQQNLQRAVFLAEHLFQMVPQRVWRDSGGDDGQGHYEGDYRAEQLRVELASLSDISGAAE